MSKLEVSTMLESFLEIYNYIEIYFVIYNLLVNFKKKKKKCKEIKSSFECFKR